MSKSDPFRLDGEVALVTGGSTGLGFGIAECFIDAGAKVVILGRRHAQLEEAVAKLGAGASFVVADVSDKPDALKAALQPVGPISILVNNAGIHLKKPSIETTDEEFLAVLQTHVLGAHRVTRLVAPGMLAAGKGSILFTASMTSLFGIPFVVAYSAAKSAYLGMVRTLTTEFASRGVRVNAIAPGWIETPMLHEALKGDPNRAYRILDRTPMQKFGEPRDVGHAAVYLCSPAAKFVTGVVLPIDGGASIGF